MRAASTVFVFFSSRRRHTRYWRDWSSDVCSSDLLASELVKSIDVFKGFTADMTEGGVGGTVSIQTRRPLELRDDLLAVTGSVQKLETLDKWRPRGNIVAGTRFLDNRLGVIVNLTYDQVDSRADFL